MNEKTHMSPDGENMKTLLNPDAEANLRCRIKDFAIKDKMAQLENYARIRDNPEAERQFAEIRLRACVRIGEISRELEKAKPNKGHGAGVPSDGKTKEQALTASGI